jgi:hypothetical protein
VIALIAAGVGYALTRDDSEDAFTVADDEVFLEPADSAGPDPFTEEIDVEGGRKLASRPAPGAQTPDTTAPGASDAAAVPSAIGDNPGLYGGTQNIASCDPQQMKAFLEGNPDKAAAWIAAQNADPNFQWSGGNRLTVDDVGAYMDSLTPITLVTDTRVTNHGFYNGAATARQAVLQAGTAVLVDEYGVPRAKCACGNPLIPPRPVPRRRYTGPRWGGFNPTTVVVVQPAPVVINVYVLIDIDTGEEFTRPAATTGADDTPTGNVVEPPDTTPETSPPESVPPDTPDLSVLGSTDFCEALAEWVARADGSEFTTEQEIIDFLNAALGDLASIAPPEVRADVVYLRDWIADNPQGIFTEDPVVEAASDRLDVYSEETCGIVTD